MRPEQLSDALHYVDDDLLRESAEIREAGKGRRPAWQRWAALAACLALVVLAGTRLMSGGGILPKPGDLPRPGSSGPSQPVQSGELPLITIQNDGMGAMGYEGYLAYDISELRGNNPWRTVGGELTTLPVYRNPLLYNDQHQASGADWEKMKALLLTVAEGLGLDTAALPVTDNAPDEAYRKAVEEKVAAVGDTLPEGYFDPTACIMEGDSIRIEVDQTLTARIDFDPPVELPEELAFTHTASREEMAAAADWLAEKYSGLLSKMAKPTLDQGMADRNIYGERSFDVAYYDGGGTAEERIVHYNFDRVAFYNDDEGKLFLARVYAPDLSGKLGDYPIITVEKAQELLLAGNYATSVPCPLPGEESIVDVELVYRTGTYEEVWLPYYRFLAELPEEYRPSADHRPGDDRILHDYGAYYVPAVEGSYITNMPTYDGGFNGPKTSKPAVPPSGAGHFGEK